MSLPLENKHHDVYPAIDPSTTLANTAAGRTVIITGAGRGIGRGIAHSFAKAGAHALVLVARSEDELNAVAQEVRGVSPHTTVVTCISKGSYLYFYLKKGKGK